MNAPTPRRRPGCPRSAPGRSPDRMSKRLRRERRARLRSHARLLCGGAARPLPSTRRPLAFSNCPPEGSAMVPAAIAGVLRSGPGGDAGPGGAGASGLDAPSNGARRRLQPIPPNGSRSASGRTPGSRGLARPSVTASAGRAPDPPPFGLGRPRRDFRRLGGDRMALQPAVVGLREASGAEFPGIFRAHRAGSDFASDKASLSDIMTA